MVLLGYISRAILFADIFVQEERRVELALGFGCGKIGCYHHCILVIFEIAFY